MEKISRLAAGTIKVRCSVENEKIENLEISGDFFAGEALKGLCDAMIGCEYNRAQVYKLLAEEKSDNIIYGVSKEELLEAIF